MGGAPVRSALCRTGAGWVNRYRDGLGRHGRVELIAAVVVLVEAGFIVVELVGQHQRVKVAPWIEGADRVGVVSPALVARHMSLDWPGSAAVERLVEAKQVIVALAADDPLTLTDQVVWVVRVDPQIRLRVILDS